MRERLLGRQVRLLEHLTTGAGIFGAGRGISNDPALHGLDLGLLHLEARFSHAKRMQKIEWVLTRTLELLGSKRAAMIRDFVEACPPAGIGWLANARQFHEFLKARWLREAPEPPYLPDIAAYEIAYATVRAGERGGAAPSEESSRAPTGAIRRRPGAVLLRCAYDIRPILEGRAGDGPAAPHETLLAVAMLPGTDEPLASEISSDLFEFLEMLDQFADPAIFQDTPGVNQLIEDLAAGGLIEVRR
jgi:hypothetical protein